MFPFTGQMLLGTAAIEIIANGEFDFGSTVTGGSVSFTYQNQNEMLFIAMSLRAPSGTTGVATATYNGVSGTKVGEFTPATGTSNLISVWRWKQSEVPTSSGSYTLALTYSGSSPAYLTVSSVSCINVDQTTPTANFASNNVAALALDSTISVTVSNSLRHMVLGFAGCGTGNDASVTQNYDPPSQMVEINDIGESGNRCCIETAYDNSCASSSEAYAWTMKSTQSGVFDSATAVAFTVFAV